MTGRESGGRHCTGDNHLKSVVFVTINVKSRFLGGGITLGKMQIVPGAAPHERCWAMDAETSGSGNVFNSNITKKSQKNQCSGAPILASFPPG